MINVDAKFVQKPTVRPVRFSVYGLVHKFGIEEALKRESSIARINLELATWPMVKAFVEVNPGSIEGIIWTKGENGSPEARYVFERDGEIIGSTGWTSVCTKLAMVEVPEMSSVLFHNKR